jgi:excinuclease ABC subunit C
MKLFDQISPPKIPGVYFFKDSYGQILYIGKAKNLLKRISCYNTNRQIDWKIHYLLDKSSSIEWIVTSTEEEALLLEASLISSHKPLFNKLLTTNNPFYYILFIKSYGQLPKISITRYIQKNATYSIGPFLKKRDALKLYSLITDAFNLNICNKKIPHGCLHYHIGKCSGTCKTDFDKKKYTKRFDLAQNAIKNESNFLETINKEIEKAKSVFDIIHIEELLKYKEEFQLIQNYLYADFREINEERSIEKILLQLNIEETTYQEAVNSIKNLLQLPNKPHIIDCIDISHFQGNAVTGACIRFDHGKYNKEFSTSYLLQNEENNDYKNLILTIKKHYLTNHITYPDILLIDGGKGQLHAVADLRLPIPLMALAKREETLFWGNNESTVLSLHQSYGRLLIQIRNATHNAAIYLHKKNMIKKNMA